MDAQAFFKHIVIPTYREFEEAPTSKRRGTLAALVIFHLIDYINADRKGNKGNLGAIKKEVMRECTPFKTVEAIANSMKHVEIRGPDKFEPDQMAVLPSATTFDEIQTKGTKRTFKTSEAMLWVEFRGSPHFVHVDLFASLNYLIYKFGLSEASDLKLPLVLAYRDASN